MPKQKNSSSAKTVKKVKVTHSLPPALPKLAIFSLKPPIHWKKPAKIALWFFIGALGGLFFFASFVYIFYKQVYATKIYPGVAINNVDMSGKTQTEVKQYFDEKNNAIQQTTITLTGPQDTIATLSAKDLHIGYNSDLLAQQAFNIGRSQDFFADVSLLIQAYTQGINLPASYTLDEDQLKKELQPLAETINQDAVEALFTFNNGRVSEFHPSVDGRKVDIPATESTLLQATVQAPHPKRAVTLALPITVKKPDITTDKVNNLGIKEVIGVGTSLFAGSIANRAYNIEVAAGKLNGVLIKPGEVFSFDKTVGDITAATGYKQAYVIKDGKTVLDDGGGVCQVSTTFFRAALAAGLPIVERHAHAYRVHYYEEDSGPGIDAAIFYPSVDLKIKNDTGHYILVQSSVDEENQRLTFTFYGTKDNRQVTISQPVVTSQTPAPPPLNQDDPTLLRGVVKQVDFAADGATVYFTRTVMKDGKEVINDTFYSNYRPWQAVFLHGTKDS